MVSLTIRSPKMKQHRSLIIVSKALAPYRVRFYSEVAKALEPTGWKVTLVVATLGAKDHPWSDPGLDSQFLEIIGTGRPQSETSSLQALADFLAKLVGSKDIELPNLSLIKVLEARNADIVWTHEYSPFCLAASLWAAVRDRGSILSTDLGSNPPKHACTQRQLRFQKWVSFLYQGVIANTKEATRREHPNGVPIIFAPHAIDTDQYFPSEVRECPVFRFLFAGGVREEKGIREVIEVGRLLAAAGHEFEIRVVGSGPLSDWLARQAEPWLLIAGFVEGAALCKEYQDADAYVLPTEGDTYAVTVHEAAASGLPLIVGKTAGAVETLVKEGKTGYVVDPHNIPELASRMKELMEDRPRARAMGLQARALAEDLDVKILGKRTAEFISHLSLGEER